MYMNKTDLEEVLFSLVDFFNLMVSIQRHVTLMMAAVQRHQYSSAYIIAQAGSVA